MEAQFIKPYATDPRTAAATLARWHHGLNSKHLLGPDEDQGELETLHQRLMRGMAPENEFEEELATNTVGTQWLIRRLHRQVCGNLDLHFQALGPPKQPTPNIKQGGAMMKDYASIRMQHHLVGQIIRLGNQTMRAGRQLEISQAQRRKGLGNGEPGSAGGSGRGARVRKATESTGVSNDTRSGEISDRGDGTLPFNTAVPAPVPEFKFEIAPPLVIDGSAGLRGDTTAASAHASTGDSNDTGSGEIADREERDATLPELRTSGAILAHALWDAEALMAARLPPAGLTAFDAGRWWDLKRKPETADQKRKRIQGRLDALAGLPVNLRAAHEDEYSVLCAQAERLRR